MRRGLLFARGKHNLSDNPILREISERYSVTIQQVIERWLIQRSVIPLSKSTHAERIRANYDVWDFELSLDDMRAIESLDTGSSQFFDWDDPAVFARFANLPFEG